MPVCDPPDWSNFPLWLDPPALGHVTRFNLAELQLTSMKLPSVKAPGLDGITNDVLGAVVEHNPDPLLAAFNACLDARVVPRQ